MAGSDVQAYSIAAFCRAHSIGRSTFFKLRQQGLAPRTMRVGKLVLISIEEAAAWRQRMTAAEAQAGAGEKE